MIIKFSWLFKNNNSMVSPTSNQKDQFLTQPKISEVRAIDEEVDKFSSDG